MSFDALLTIVFILFFVLGPLIRRISGGQGRQPPPGRKPPVVPPAGSEEHRREASTARDSGEGSAAEGGLSERLEEARRRVLEAMGEETGGAGGRREATRDTGSRSERSGSREAPPNTMGRQAERAPLDWQPAPSTGSDRPPLDWQAEATTASTRQPLDWQSSANRGGSKGSGLDWQEVITPAESFIPRVERRRRRATRVSVSDTETASPKVRTERRDKRARAARLSDGRVLALGRGGILRGLIWHEILSEPVSKRGTRRQSSRLRSR